MTRITKINIFTLLDGFLFLYNYTGLVSVSYEKNFFKTYMVSLV